MIYGYHRSPNTQMINEELQRAGAIAVFYDSPENIQDRSQLDVMFDNLQPGDVVVVMHLGAFLGCPLTTLGIIRDITLAGASFKALYEMLSTTTDDDVVTLLKHIQRSMQVLDNSIRAMNFAKQVAILTDLRDGESYRTISVLHGISETTLRKYFGKVTRWREKTCRHTSFTMRQLNNMVSLAKGGTHYNDIAKKYGITQRTVYNLIGVVKAT